MMFFDCCDVMMSGFGDDKKDGRYDGGRRVVMMDS
jgi:hypothetical protein